MRKSLFIDRQVAKKLALSNALVVSYAIEKLQQDSTHAEEVIECRCLYCTLLKGYTYGKLRLSFYAKFKNTLPKDIETRVYIFKSYLTKLETLNKYKEHSKFAKDYIGKRPWISSLEGYDILFSPKNFTEGVLDEVHAGSCDRIS